MNEIMKVTQLPVIEERLQALKSEIEEKTSTALSLECSDKTLKTVKEMRTELRKEFDELETLRKEVKAKIAEPYNAFEKVYKECVSAIYKKADVELKAKIYAVENEKKKEKRAKLINYAEELKLAYGLNWLDVQRVLPNVTLSVSFSALIEKTAAIFDRLQCDVESIGDNAELLAEYQNTLNLATATTTLRKRQEAIEQAKKQSIKTKEKAEKAEQIEQAVNEVLQPPKPQEKKPSEKTYKMSFTVLGTLEQLRAIKNYLEERGIQYE